MRNGSVWIDVDADKPFVKYQEQLDEFLFNQTCNLGRKAMYLQSLARLIVDSSSEPLDTTLRWFDLTLRQSFERYTKWQTGLASDGSRPWEDIASKLLDYSMRFQEIHEHVKQIDKNMNDSSNEPLEFFLKHLLVRALLEKEKLLLVHFKSACECFLHGERDCGPHINLIYRSVRDFAAAIDLTSAYKVEFNRTVLDYFTRIGFKCLQDYLDSNPQGTFCDRYRVWHNCVELFDLTGYSGSDACSTSLMFENSPHLLMESLNGTLIKCTDLQALTSLDPRSEWASGIQDAYTTCREVMIEDSFDQLLASVLLLNYAYPYTEKFEAVRKSRLDFIDNIKDVAGFHTKLINYFDLSFKKNYDGMRRTPDKLPDQSLGLWALAAFFLVKFHVPKPEALLERYVEESLIPQMLMLNTKFPSYYNNSHCLQRLWIEKLRKSGPLRTEFYFSIVDEFLKTLENDQTVDNTLGFPMIKLYLPKSRHQSWLQDIKNTEIPVWPCSQLERRWDEEVQRFARQKKDLRGLFNMHTVTMSSPFCLPGGRRLTLLTNLSAASIIYQFNEFDLLKVSELCKLLGTDHEATIIDNLDKLERCGILKQEDKLTYRINDRYKPPPGVARSGVIRCI